MNRSSQAAEPLSPSPLKFALDAKVPILGFFALEFYVLHDDLIRNIARTGRKVPAGPYMPAPECPTERLELGEHFPRAFPLDTLHEPADGQVRRNRYEHVNMIS